ncbi:FtsW/RodA/SpoVE family cell cycle protein [Sutcliffiella horikoshii]|uniref:FtsW/RodA/SpoVE family cell cycle protein n=1 Tax=Sutcliffiella horikoshii TaxID=79883 RepID=A0A5D4T818_9BACI|nr:FtsW/RodA/SpoVE family cell cycle protein [Sutcliffiella horikoshii]TYS71803.1 FtsW/RodA/SpoVE family cell cycle protein [Sutcliffiella horikoshii]
MSSPIFDEFLTKVISKVKSKDAHSMIKKELHHHLLELSQSFQNREDSKEKAEEKAVQEMGNPYSIGEKLNKLHKPRMDWMLIILFTIIGAISFLPLIGNAPGSLFLEKQAIWFSLGTVVLISFLFFDYRKLKNWWFLFYSSGVLLLLYLLVFGVSAAGVKRWVSFGGFTVDAATISILLFFLAWSGIFTKPGLFNGWRQGMVFGLFWVPFLLFMMLPSFPYSIIYFSCVLTMFIFSSIRKRTKINLIIAKLATCLLIIVPILVSSQGSLLSDRLFTFLSPEQESNGPGYMYILIKGFLADAGWFGNGLNGNSAIQSLPDAHTDFAFPYLVHSHGWAFGIFLCMLLIVFIWKISRNASKTKDAYGRILVVGGVTLIAVPAIWNILMGLGFAPIIGVSLPFISYGGTTLLFYSAVLGIILSVYRRKDIVEPSEI